MKLNSAALRTLLLGMTVAANGAIGANTNIAQVPLLNIDGTGTVKPNLMVLYDNSGSMQQTYTPDYVDDPICRAGPTLNSDAPRGCRVGDPLFMAPDFNRQYYNPKITYTPPVKADGTFYPNMTAAQTSDWTNVRSDGFEINRKNLRGQDASSINLVSGFPDSKWCKATDAADCKVNTYSYTYPDATYKVPWEINGSPHYYTILTAEYCTDRTLSTCVPVTPGAGAPTGYPFPAKVRWCTNVALTNCQAKYQGTTHPYPRFSSPNTPTGASYAVVTVGLTSNNSPVTISGMHVAEANGAVNILNGAIVVNTGIDTAAKQRALVNTLAASIVAKTGLPLTYTACVKTSTDATVKNCSDWGITLSSENLLAVIPIACANNTSKNPSNCSIVSDNSRDGWGITLTSNARATALIRVTGATSNYRTAVLSSGTRLGGTSVISTNISFAYSSTAATVAAAIASNVSATNIRAYVAPNLITRICANTAPGNVCIVDSGGVPGATVTMGSLSNNGGASGTVSSGNIVFTPVASSQAGELPITSTAVMPRGAVFLRTDIKPTQTAYPRDAARTDCADTATCSYAEEMTNVANWYTYYKTRNQMMKSALGQAFAPITEKFRVGIVALSTAAANGTFEQLPADFTGTDRASWYSKLYAMNGSSTTPTRGALHNVGHMYADTVRDVVKYPCQQNFTFVTSDGYWNGSGPTGVVDNDKLNPARFCTAVKGCPDARVQSSASLADVALFWYNGGSNTGTVSLRPDLDPMNKPGQVPGAADDNTHLHMKTYTLGLGMVGMMDFDPNYDTAPRVGGDFHRLITGATGCPWNNNGVYVWPDPQTGSSSSTVQERVDDLWHAAINGRGKYFSAQDPQEVITGVNAALNNIQARTGAAAAAATSTPNISQDDNDIFTDTFTTVKWYGELSKKKIDMNTGEVLPGIVWTTTNKLGTQVVVDGAGNDGRTIKMAGPTAGTLKNFLWSEMTPQEKAWFDNKCMTLAQCTSLSTTDRVIANTGANLVNWLRGRQQYANNEIFRAYAKTSGATPLPIVLGDIASAKPAYLREPRKSYAVIPSVPSTASFTGYSAFKEANKNRQATVFVAANDGMLHAFKASGANEGSEMWAYAPRITMHKLHKQASTTYGTNHQFTVDGSPELADVKIGGVWKTVLVAGLNAGGRGYYALDVTNPANPVALWEICADSSVCALNDPDIGLTFGNPQIGMWNNKWVVFLTSGYNNVPGTDGVATGNGGGYLYIYDVATGEQLLKVGTGSGDATTPSGFAKITAVSKNPDVDANITAVYGGDNLGQMWRFAMPGGAIVNKTLMTTTGAAQPITTRPEVTGCRVGVRLQGGVSDDITHQVVVFGTGRLLDLPDVTDTTLQSVYAIKDSPLTVAPRGANMAKQTLVRIGATGNYNLEEPPAAGGATFDGWYTDFDLNPGERANLDPKVIRGTTVVVTNVPAASSSCSVGGSSNLYQINACSGRAVDPDAPVGRVLSNTSAAVGFIIVRTATGALKLVTTLADGNLGTTNVEPALTESPRKGGWRPMRNQ